jgi:hypothetical protein
MIEVRAFSIALLVPTLAWAQQSQFSNIDQPAPKRTETIQPKAEPDLRGTTQMPLAVEIVRTEADKEKERREQVRENSKAAEEDELVRATWALVVVTALLAVFTGFLFWFTRNLAKNAKEESDRALEASAKALAASTAATQTLIRVERPYVTGGGYSPNHGPGYGARQFHLEVQNLGKTPAFLTDYDVQLAKLADLTDRPAREVERRFHYDDRLAPGEKKEIDLIPVEPSDADVVFGAVWYLDWAKERHEFRFVLRIAGHDTRPDISRLVHADYSKWD